MQHDFVFLIRNSHDVNMPSSHVLLKWKPWHYGDIIMTTMASQITSLTIVYSTVYSDADQRKHHSSASLAFVWGIHRDRWIPRTKGQLRGKYYHLMTSSWEWVTVQHFRVGFLFPNLAYIPTHSYKILRSIWGLLYVWIEIDILHMIR